MNVEYQLFCDSINISELESNQSPSTLFVSKDASKDQQKNQFENKFHRKILADSQIYSQTIVILGGGRRLGALYLPKYHYQDISPASIERVRFGTRLAKQAKLPTLLTGGAPE